METDRESRQETVRADDLLAWQREIVRVMLLIAAIVGALATIGVLYEGYLTGRLWQVVVGLGAYALLLGVTVWRSAPYSLRAGVLLSLLFGLGAANLLVSPATGDGLLFLVVVPALAGLLFGERPAFVALGCVFLALVVCGALAPLASFAASGDGVRQSVDFGQWASRGFVVLVVASGLALAQGTLQRRLVRALQQSGTRVQELEQQRARLRLQVDERAMDLELRAQYLEAITEVTRTASSIIDDPQALLAEVADLVSERFGFYHTGVFLLDEDAQWAVLRAASSEGGQHMLVRGHRLRTGQEGIVGFVAGRGQPRIALDVGEDAIFFGNPDLPETRSEMALPLRVRGETIGVLDVQSTESAAFSGQDVAVLQILADQVAIAISNAQLFQRVQASIDAIRRAYGDIGLEMWRDLLRSTGAMRERYDPQRLLSDAERPAATSDGPPGGEALHLYDNGVPAAVTPIRTRGGHAIGVVDARKPRGAGDWTAEELALLGSLVDQLGVALDGAQLYQDAQERAERERLVGDIAAQIREHLDTDEVLQTAIQAIGRSLALSEVEVRMGIPPPDRGGAWTEETAR